MIRSQQNRRIVLVLMVCGALALGACGSDDGSSQGNNGFDLRSDVSSDDVSTDAGGGEDTGGEGTGGEDATGEDAADGTDPNSPLNAEALSSGRWYAVTLLSAEPAATGSILPLDFHEDMTVTLGFRGEVTGEFAFFGDERVRLYNLMRGDQPNQPQQFLLDADIEGDRIEGLEIVIPDAGGGEPSVLRFEQQSTPAVTGEDIAGDWQSEQTYTGENNDSYRLAIRMLAGTFGYGGYNGAYIEFIPGDLEMITYDTGETFWFSVPPASGNSVPSLAGEARSDGEGGYTIWAPREVTPQSGEFESVEMHHVEAFTNP